MLNTSRIKHNNTTYDTTILLYYYVLVVCYVVSHHLFSTIYWLYWCYWSILKYIDMFCVLIQCFVLFSYINIYIYIYTNATHVILLLFDLSFFGLDCNIIYIIVFILPFLWFIMFPKEYITKHNNATNVMLYYVMIYCVVKLICHEL